MSPEVDASSPIIDTSRPIVVDMSQDLSAVLWNGLGVSGDECGIGSRIVPPVFRPAGKYSFLTRRTCVINELAIGSYVYVPERKEHGEVIALDPLWGVVRLRLDISDVVVESSANSLRRPLLADSRARTIFLRNNWDA